MNKYLQILLVLLVFNILSCKKENGKQMPQIVKIDSISFSKNIQPILTTSCSDPNCHNGMDVYANLIAQPKPIVVPKDTSSLFSLYQAVYTKRMPQGTNKLADSLVKQIGIWIMQGALDN